MNTLLHLMELYGYIALFWAMAAENANIPIPSEVILGFSGFLISQQVFSFWPAFFIACCGGIFGSIISYWLGAYGGRPLLRKYGKYILFNEKKFNYAEQLFTKYGGIAIIIGRCLPGIRTFISFPAGVARYPFVKFILYSIIGTIPWTLLLVWAGCILGSHWQDLIKYNHILIIGIGIITFCLILFFICKHIGKKNIQAFLYAHRYELSLLIFSCLLLLPFLGAFPLTDPDEPVYGETAREMLVAHDWLSPRIFGHVWYDKPPLFYWLEMISYQLFGISDYSSRLPSAILAIITIQAVYHYGKSMFNSSIAYISALILTSSFGFWYIGKAAITDMTLIFTLTIALLSFYTKKYYRGYIFCGLALLAKGPIGYAFPALIMLCYIIIRRKWNLLSTLKIPQGILCAFIVGLPWYILMYQVHGTEFIQTFIGYHNIIRFTAPEHPGRNSIFFFIPVLILSLIPWITAYVPALIRFFRKKDTYTDALWFCFIWSTFIFVFFSLSKTQLISYIAPMFPPTAFLIGWFLYRCYEEKKRSLITIFSSYVLGLLCLGLYTIPLHGSDVIYRPFVYTLSISLCMLCIIPASLWWHTKKIQAAYAIIPLGMLVISLLSSAVFLPQISPTLTSTKMATSIKQRLSPTDTLYIEKFLRPGIAFYSGYYGKSWVSPQELDLAKIKTTTNSIYVIMRKTTYTHNKKLFAPLSVVMETETQILLTNH